MWIPRGRCMCMLTWPSGKIRGKHACATGSPSTSHSENFSVCPSWAEDYEQDAFLHRIQGAIMSGIGIPDNFSSAGIAASMLDSLESKMAGDARLSDASRSAWRAPRRIWRLQLYLQNLRYGVLAYFPSYLADLARV